ncbi:MAG: 4Fe-4S binding protein [Rhizobiaceae bacterium]
MGSQDIDVDALSSACGGMKCSNVHTELCLSEIEIAAEAIRSGDAIIACQQERRRFEDLAAELEIDPPGFVDIRDRAGWSADKNPKTAKMAALVAEAQLPAQRQKLFDIVSEGLCLVMGASETALEAADQLSNHLSVTVLLPPEFAKDSQIGAGARQFDIVFGDLRIASGSLGNFDLTIDKFTEPVPGGRDSSTCTEARDGAQSQCDIIVDLSGAAPLFPAHKKRDGYLRADPRSAGAVAKTVLDASHLTGTFEKPLHVRLDEQLCAHSRAQKTGCSKCLDNCPTGAITPNGDFVTVDPAICAGCGTCSAICPSGAISYDTPAPAETFKRIETLASTYRKIAKSPPRLLVHDEDHGREMISLCARHDRGLPSDVIPMEVSALAAFGHAEMLAALGSGFASVTVLLSPNTDNDAVERELMIVSAIGGTGAINLLDIADPAHLADHLYNQAELNDPVVKPVLPLGSRRQVTRLAAKAIRPDVNTIELPQGAPYGTIMVDTEACTLCLACVSLCPSGALGDNTESPQLRLQESACLQCGLCKNTCPESAISLKPQLNLADEALSHQVLHEEEPFACIECGKPFGVKSTVMRITEKLAGKHAMFENSDAVKIIQMCDDCRVNAQFHSENNPFAGGERPRVRTTDDYLSKRRDH